MAFRYDTRVGFGGPPWRQLGPGCRIVADATLGFVVAACQAGLVRGTWWSIAAGGLSAVAYLAVPAQLEALVFVIVGVWLAASQIATKGVWIGILAGAAAADTTTLYLFGLTALVAAMATPVDMALIATILISIAVMIVIVYAVAVRPTRKLVAQVAPKEESRPLLEDPERGAIVPTMLM